MINSVRTTVQATANKHNFGYLPPADFNLFAKQAQMEIFEDIVYRYNTWLNQSSARRSNAGLGNITKNILEDIEVFSATSILSPVTGSTYALATDTYHVDTITVNGVEADKETQGRITKLNASNLTAPTLDDPVYVKTGNNIRIYPSGSYTVIENYLRFPLDPKWTWATISGGEPLFNQSASDYQDFELPASYGPELCLKILAYLGLSIREPDLVGWATNEEIEDKQVKS